MSEANGAGAQPPEAANNGEPDVTEPALEESGFSEPELAAPQISAESAEEADLSQVSREAEQVQRAAEDEEQAPGLSGGGRRAPERGPAVNDRLAADDLSRFGLDEDGTTANAAKRSGTDKLPPAAPAQFAPPPGTAPVPGAAESASDGPLSSFVTGGGDSTFPWGKFLGFGLGIVVGVVALLLLIIWLISML